MDWSDDSVDSPLGLEPRIPDSIPSLRETGTYQTPSFVSDSNLKQKRPSHRVTFSKGHVEEMKAESLHMTHPRKHWVKDSVGQLLHTHDTGQGMKEDKAQTPHFNRSKPNKLLCFSTSEPTVNRDRRTELSVFCHRLYLVILPIDSHLAARSTFYLEYTQH